MIIAELAASLLQLDQRIHGLDQQIAATFRRHHQAKTDESMPGFGPILGAQLLVAAGDLRATPAPATWPLQPAWCRSATPLADDPATCTNRAVTADRCGTCSICPRRFLPQETPGGNTHAQAVITLARRRIDVLWALLSRP